MRKKWTLYAVLGYLLFAGGIYYYLYGMGTEPLPSIYKGTSADPAGFLSGEEQELSAEYSKVRNLLYFLSAPLEWLMYLFIVLFGLSRWFEKWAVQTARFSFIQTAAYVFYLALFTAVLTFPIQYIGFHFSKAYGISAQTFAQWMRDELIDFWIGYGIMTILIFVLYGLMRKFKKKWWLAAWGLFVPYTVFMMYVQPVIIDPIYNDFYPLKDKELEEEILSLAEKADIPSSHVFEVNMSDKTRALNAYVTGIGSNARIVLWDTMLSKLSKDEILFVMAHEMAHYVKKHIYVGMIFYLLLAFFGFWLTAVLTERFIGKYGRELKMTKRSQLRTLPLLLMFISLIGFASSPLSNMVSRFEEKQSDAYAIEMTGDKEAAISAFQKLAKEGLSEVKPPLLVKIFRYSHPSMAERLYTIETYPLDESKKEEKDGKST
ncbi:M48 family metallopeptidase [Bacillus xiapuensis]|uniref:M48 family metallopeptidase n=1 Tax=Bacillus xiapuensis TaxID=2014075 RepID=UPI001E43A163|nr:M48 family metallopeptidase [Bacillus xiapuensis]